MSALSNYTHIAYSFDMKAVFKELVSFEAHRAEYLSDEAFLTLQMALMRNPEAGPVIQGTGGLRKVRCGNASRGKGKRGGVRIIYYWFSESSQFWLFTLYGKEVADDLTHQQKSILKEMLQHEKAQRV
jgi:mRNA-degrading endonuclease RelE of RelBE toxin-antitoxin system|tara:strand:+ start:116 stop:499 length:384 start_codon:yes stop_codon:yes gene_type:complete